MDSKCRFCGGTLGSQALTLTQMPLTDDFISVDNQGRQEYLEDIRIHECSSCGFIQNPMDFDHEGYYQDYQYSSGHSAFVRNFMSKFADSLCGAFQKCNGRQASAILEVGSGDGEQLKFFRQNGAIRLLGVEPSRFLAEAAQTAGIPTVVGLFGKGMVGVIKDKFDICLSSYTLDHVRNPLEYLQAAKELLVDGGLLAFEVHDFDKIAARTEYCLFEHEHTIYMNASDAIRLVNSQGFDLVEANPVPEKQVRGNSLIVVARKRPAGAADSGSLTGTASHHGEMLTLGERIATTISRLDDWVRSFPGNQRLVGFGAGGRGVMTLAAMETSGRFAALFDSNFESGRYVTPKTRVPLVGPDRWAEFADSHCLVFSFGYLEEIKGQLAERGFAPDKVHSLLDYLG